MAKKKLQKPGEKPSGPGEFIERGPLGGKKSNARQVTMEPGDNPLPPTTEAGNTWEKKRSRRSS